MNIFFRELKANRKALIIWSVCMIIFVASGMMKYTAYSVGGSSSDVFAKLPYSIKALFGMGSFDITKASGFFAFLFLYIELTVAIHAVLIGAGIISKEESDKTTEFLMVKPVSRGNIITNKLLAALLNVVVINIVTLITSILMVASYNKGKDVSGEIAMFMLSMFIVQLVFLSLGAAFAAFIKNAKASGSLGIGVLLIAFVVCEITNLTNKIDFINILSPFKYFSYSDIVAGKGISIGNSLLSIVLIGIFTFSTYFFYKKRDLTV
jgi:ABC-2 type transport system permease protein